MVTSDTGTDTGTAVERGDDPTSIAQPSRALTVRPDALLLDFGGVVFSTIKRPDGIAAAAAGLRDSLERAGHAVDPQRLEASLTAGLAALKHWKHAMSRTLAPAELTHRQVWEDFLLADLQPAIRATAAADAEALLHTLNRTLNDHAVRPGIRQLVEVARSLGIPVGIVSNAHSGRAHRQLLRDHDLESFFAVQLYSDELGIRKPNPGMLQAAAAALATTPERCWYVGDTQDRDLVAARRAGVGAVVLTESKHTRTPPFAVHECADAILPTPEGLAELLAAAVDRPPVGHAPGSGGVSPLRRHARPAALLLDQGGVLTSSTKQPARVDEFVGDIVDLLRAAGHAIEVEAMREAVEGARRAYQDRKDCTEAPAERTKVIPEISPREFWGGLVGERFGPGVRAWLTAEASEIMLAYTAAKASVQLRDGVPELLAWCRDRDVPVAIVSNTLSGRNGRRRLAEAGVGHLVRVHAYSDEVGRRKPDPALVWAATAALAVDPRDCWFVGDKPWRDVAAGRAAGVGTVVVVRNGSPTAERLATSLDDPGLAPDLLLDDMHAVHRALSALPHPAHTRS